jgi:hypothetical protein
MKKDNEDDKLVKVLTAILSAIKSPSQLEPIIPFIQRLPQHINAIICFPGNEENEFILLEEIPALLNEFYITPYLSYRNICLIENPSIVIPTGRIDFSITFDSNFADYIYDFVLGNEIDNAQAKYAIKDICNKNLNFDSFFYWAENIKIAYPLAKGLQKKGLCTPLNFWVALDKKFRWNLVCVELFRNMNFGEYAKNRKKSYLISFIQSVRDSVRLAYEFYSGEGQILIEGRLLPMQMSILRQLIAIYYIQFSEKGSPVEKLDSFLQRVHKIGSVYYLRETELAYAYFNNQSSVPFLNVVNRGGKSRIYIRNWMASHGI